MIFSRTAIVACLAGGLLLPAAFAHAQTSQRPQVGENADASGNIQNVLGNNSVSGVCMLSRGAVLSQSKVGQAANSRLRELAQNARQDMQKQQGPLQKDIKRFRQNADSMSDSARKNKQQELQQRMRQSQQKARQLRQRVRLTRNEATQKIGRTLDPLIGNIYKQHDCGILLDRDNVLGGNPKNDLTNQAINALDNKMTTISFDLAPLPKGQQGQSNQRNSQ